MASGKNSSVYVIATANNADNLPPELKRKGRFDEIFCVNLPTDSEREAILKVHLKKREQDLAHKNLSEIIKATSGFNGADIESVVNEALENKFVKQLKASDNKTSEQRIQLTSDDLIRVANGTISITKSCKTQIENMNKVFKESNFKNASSK